MTHLLKTLITELGGVNIESVANIDDHCYCDKLYKVETEVGQFYVFADCAGDALDALADSDLIDGLKITDDLLEEYGDDACPLGNCSDKFDINNIRIKNVA